jgi:peptide subunit release factor 1 (eRF1)
LRAAAVAPRVLDDLLGRTELKERIDELEEENEHLERQLDAEQERRADAASARQEAEERGNRLEDRIADLEGQLDREREGVADLQFRRREQLRGDRMRSVLSRLDAVDADGEGALTAMVDDEVPDAVADLFGERAALVSRAAPCVVVADDAGLVAATLEPPVAPDPFVTWDDGFDLDRSWFLPTGDHAVALVRSDLFALGRYRGDERFAVEGFESDVKGDHSKGGFSQARFERRRDEQIAEHLRRCRDRLEDVDDPLYVVGDRDGVDELGDLATATAAVDATGDPEAALDDAVRSFWTTRLSGI